MNIVCMLASGVGNRFGSSIPKQSHLVNGRPVSEYTIAAALGSEADEVVVVATHPHIEELESKYGVVCVEGSKERGLSLINGLNFIKENYDCKKVIVIDAIYPLVTPALMNQYFKYLDEYDAVFTTANVPTSLGKRDGTKVARDDYFMVQSPDAYRFDIIYGCLEETEDLTSPMNSLPDTAKVKHHYGFKNYAKIIYPHDIAVIEVLLNEQAKYKRLDTHKNDISLRYFQIVRNINKEVIKKWEKVIDREIEELFQKWGIYEFSLNADGVTGIVIEAKSHVYGSVFIKINSPVYEERFKKEIAILTGLKKYPQCKIYDYDSQKRAMFLERIKPGDYIDFYDDQEQIKQMFINMENNKEKAENVQHSSYLRGVKELTEIEYEESQKVDYHNKLMAYLMEEMRRIYKETFENDEKFVLHGDAYFKNTLRGEDEIKVIDPVGYNAPFIFEYMPFFTYEILWHSKDKNYKEKYNELIDYFETFTDVSRFKEAAFVFCVKQIISSIYQVNDGFVRANLYLEMIKDLFLDENNQLILNKENKYV